MNNINFFALGGLGENGKNFYLLQIENAYFVLDAGLKYPNTSFYGIDAIIADYYKLKDIKDQIKGVFLSSSFESHLGALSYLMKDLQLPIYASYFTIQVLQAHFYQHKINYRNFNLNIVKSGDIVNFDDVGVSFFATSQQIPETLGMILQTKYGAIVYTGELKLIHSKNKFFQTNFSTLYELSSKKVLAFLPSVQGAFVTAKNEEEDNFEYHLQNYYNHYSLQNEGNIVIASLMPDLLKIQLAIDLACKLNFKIGFIGKKSEKIIEVALRKSFLKIPDYNLVELRDFNDSKKHQKLVVFVFGKHFETLYRLQKMSQKTDRLMHLTSNDLVLLLSKDMPGISKIQSQTLDILSHNNINAHVIIKDLSSSGKDYETNLKIMLNFLKPQYIIPVAGEYRHQYQVKQIALQVGFKAMQVFLLENGFVWQYQDLKEPWVDRNIKNNAGEILIDGTPVVEGQDFIMKDRELLAADGVVIVVANVNARIKKIIGEVKLVSKGFLSLEENNKVFLKLRSLFDEKSSVFLKNKYLNWNDFKKNIRESLAKFLFKETKKRPIVIPIFISVKND